MTTSGKELETSSFSNDHLTVTVSKYPHCIVKCDIVVNPPAVKAANVKAIKNVSKEVSIPGFRKGKAPEKWIKEKYQSSIEKEGLDVLLNTAFHETLELANLHVLKDGHFERPVVHECSEDKGARFTLEFEVRPTIPSVIPKDLQLHEIEATPITSEQEEMTLHRIQLSHATFEPITDRGLEDNDFGRINIELVKPFAKTVAENEFLEMNEKFMPSWIYNSIKGLKVGESVEAESPEKSPEAKAETETAIYRITVKEVSKGILPEIDDELAKKVGLGSADILKDKIREELTRNAAEELEQKMNVQLEKALLEKFHFDLPKSLIEIEKKFIYDEQLDHFRKEGHNDSVIKANISQIEQFAEETAVKKLQLFFLSRKIAHEFKLSPSEDDISQELQHQLFLMNQGKSLLDLNADKSTLRKQIEDFAFEKKVKKFLISHATKG